MTRSWKRLALLCAILVAGAAQGQETPSANATRKKLKQKISVDFKDITTKGMFDDIKAEMDKPCSFKIDTVSGISLNTKWSYKAKDKPIDEMLSELSDKFEWGWFVKSDAKDRLDGWIIIRKAKEKERGYEGGKEPKKGAALDAGLRFLAQASLQDVRTDPMVRAGIRWLALTRKD